MNSKVSLKWDSLTSQISIEELGRLRLALGSKLNLSGELVVSSQEHRSQFKNKKECEAKLEALLTRALVTAKPRVSTKPTYRSKLRRLVNKKHQKTKKGFRKPDWD